MKRLILLIFVLLPLWAAAQSYLYKGRSTFSGDVLYTFDGQRLYKGRSTFSGNVLYTLDGRYIYRGRSTFSTSTLYTLEGTIPVAVLVLLL